MPTILVLGGTSDAKRLCQQITSHSDFNNYSLVVSQKTGTKKPGYRIGGFGGAKGLEAWCINADVNVIIDMTHPFSIKMQTHAVQAAQSLCLPLLRFHRPKWTLPTTLPRRSFVDMNTMMYALKTLPPTRILSTLGHKALSGLSALSQHMIVARVTEAPQLSYRQMAHLRIVVDRGPFPERQERLFFDSIQPTILLSKDSGGSATFAKIRIATEKHIPVWLLSRPLCPVSYKYSFSCHRTLMSMLVSLIGTT